MVHVIDHHHWRPATSGQALFFGLEKNPPIWRALPHLDAELGFQQVSELIYFKELDMVGTLPPEVQQTIFFSAGLVEGAQEKDAALHLARFLASPAVAAIVRNTGLDPATSDPAAKSR